MRQLIPLEHSTKLKPIHQPQIGHALQQLSMMNIIQKGNEGFKVTL